MDVEASNKETAMSHSSTLYRMIPAPSVTRTSKTVDRLFAPRAKDTYMVRSDNRKEGRTDACWSKERQASGG